MKPLTVDFLKSLGFKLTDTTHEDDFYYEDWYLSGLDIALTVFATFHNDGKLTFEVDLDGWELINVGQDELKTLIKIIPSKQ